MGYYGLDGTYLLVLLGTLLCIWASARVKRIMEEYSRYPSECGLTAEEVARRILNNEGLYEVQIECLSSSDGDHYDPRTNTVRLSCHNFGSSSITAIGVAAHECGHAIQHAKGYAPLDFRTALVPVVNIGSKAGIPLILLGVFLSYNQVLIQLGIWAFALAVLFQVVTLPVEFNASSRALVKLSEYGLVTEQEKDKCKKILSAAAMTYVAATISTALQWLRLIILFGGGNRRRRR